jgi:hypothetical protein
MAVRNVTPFLFPAKHRISQHEVLGEHLHSLADVKPERNLYFFVCESQPLLTITSHRLPKAVPGMQAELPDRQRKTKHERRSE